MDKSHNIHAAIMTTSPVQCEEDLSCRFPELKGANHPVLCHGWTIYVSLHRFSARHQTQSFLSSWEYITTLDYEWRVIRPLPVDDMIS